MATHTLTITTAKADDLVKILALYDYLENGHEASVYIETLYIALSWLFEQLLNDAGGYLDQKQVDYLAAMLENYADKLRKVTIER